MYFVVFVLPCSSTIWSSLVTFGSRRKGDEMKPVLKRTVGMPLAACALAIGFGGCSWEFNNPDPHTRTINGGLRETDTIISSDDVVRPAGRFTLHKVIGDDGSLRILTLDENGHEFTGDIDEGSVSSVMGDTLAGVISAVQPGELLTVVVSLRDDINDDPPVATFGSAQTNAFESIQGALMIDGVPATLDDVRAQLEATMQHRSAVQAERRSVRYGRLSELSAREGWNVADSELQSFADGFQRFVRVMAAGDIQRFTEENADLVGAIDLYQDSVDFSLATAMAATSASPGALQFANSQGDGIGVWLTEWGCPPASFLTDYSVVFGSDNDHSRMTTSIVRAVSPKSWIYCHGGQTLPNASQLLGGYKTVTIGPRPITIKTPPVYVVSQSSGGVDGVYTDFDELYDNFVYDHSVLVVQAAGNMYPFENPHGVANPGCGLNVLTVGNYDDANNTIHFSSWGGNPPNTKNEKPEISAPGTNINAGGFTKTGNSFSAPHGAGLLADWQQAYTWLQLRPALLRATAIASARDPIAGNKDWVGEGGFDYMFGYYYGHHYWWTGSNSSFTAWAANSPGPSNAVDVLFGFGKGQAVRNVLAWVTRGTYTYEHRNDAHPIGVDLDLTVLDPNGNYVASSASWYDSYEIVNFTAPVSGNYTVRIWLAVNRDPTNKISIGMVGDW